MDKKRAKPPAELKENLLEQFESCLFDFWGEEPTRRGIVDAWIDFMDSVREDEDVPKEYYRLTMDEKRRLYRVAGI